MKYAIEMKGIDVKWEYKLVEVQRKYGGIDFEKEGAKFKEEGLNGWELVTIHGESLIVAVYKRPLKA